MQRKKISIVIPVFNEEKGLQALHEELAKTFVQLKQYDFEIIFINDGSKDNSLLQLYQLAETDQKVKILDFSRNFGKEVALSAGCHHAKGDAVITMDADLQHPVELIGRMLEIWQEKKCDIVYTLRNGNHGASMLKKTTSDLYWWLFEKISAVHCEPHSTDYRLMDKKVIDMFKKFPERSRLFRGIIDWMGFKKEKIEFIAPPRKFGSATYSYRKLIGLAVNSITSFSLLPLRIAGYLGIIITFGSAFLFVVLLIIRLFINPAYVTSLAFVAVANTLLIGIVLICLGFIALYIARIHDEVVGRPLYIVQRKVNFDD